MTLLAFLWAVAWEEHSETIIRAAGVLAACGVIGRYVVLPVVRFFKRVERSLVAVETQLLTNNGGSTVLDKVDRLVSDTAEIKTQIASIEEWRLKQQGEH